MLRSLVSVATLLVLICAGPAVAQDSPVTSQLIKQMYDGGWPDTDELKSVHEQFLLQRAVQSYMMTLPTLNVIGMRELEEYTPARN
jgi:hypothetical protein